MKTLTTLTALALSACSAYPMIAPPSPALCRAHGVSVAEDATPTGRIVQFDYVRQDEVLTKCEGVSEYGCAIRVGVDQYRVVVGPDPDHSVRTEEECHALYQVAAHTKEQQDE